MLTSKEVLEKYHQKMWVEKDLSALDELVDQNFVDDSQRDPSKSGPENAKAFFQGLFASFPDLKSETQVLIAEGEYACIMWEMTGTYNGQPLWGMPVTGKPFKVRGMDLLQIKDGKIVRDWGGMVEAFPKIFEQVGLKQQQ